MCYGRRLAAIRSRLSFGPSEPDLLGDAGLGHPTYAGTWAINDVREPIDQEHDSGIE